MPEYELSREITTGMSAPPIGNDQQDAEQQRQRAHEVERPGRGIEPGHLPHPQRDDHQEHEGIDRLLHREGDRLPGHAFLELGPGDEAPAQGDRADQERRLRGDGHIEAGRGSGEPGLEVLGPADQQ
jgi:hypothetical protein